MIMFGVAEILFSQIPDFDQISWLSMVAAVMSFTYSSIGLGLGLAKVAGTKLISIFVIFVVILRSLILETKMGFLFRVDQRPGNSGEV